MDAQAETHAIAQDIDSIWTDLYDSLLVQSLLQHAASLRTPHVTLRSLAASQEDRSEWHRFLDDLCFLCDSQYGGKNVVAVIVEQDSGKTIFWIATSPRYQTGTVSHLKKILRQLRRYVRPRSGRLRDPVEEIIQESIKRSTPRVENYRRILLNLISGGPQSPVGASQAALLDVLKNLVGEKEHALQLCYAAYRFRYERGYALLEQQIKTEIDDLWPRVRHYIGRLGHWHKTAESLARNVRAFASKLECFEVRCIPYSNPIERASLVIDEDLRDLVQRVFPNMKGLSCARRY